MANEEEVDEFDSTQAMNNDDIMEEIENIDDDMNTLTRRRETLTKELAKREAEECRKSTKK